MKRFVFSAVTLTLLLSASMALAAVEAPGDMVLRPPEGMEAKKSFVDFSHSIHGAAKIDCVTCHHTWDQKSEISSCSVAGCHDQPGKKGDNSFYMAFHEKQSDISCLGCHKTEKKNGNKNVPVSCKSCHPK